MKTKEIAIPMDELKEYLDSLNCLDKLLKRIFSILPKNYGGLAQDSLALITYLRNEIGSYIQENE